MDQIKEEGIYAEIDAESDSESKKRTNLRSAIVRGAGGATVGGMLGAAFGDSMATLEGAVIGGVLGAVASRFLKIKGQKKVVFLTGREVDLYLNTTPPIMKYIKDKVDSGIKVEGNLYFLSNKNFVKECIEYITKHINSETGFPYTEEEATERALRSSAYTDKSEIFINQDKAYNGTLIHEAIHLFQDKSYDFGININEGTTEYFTRLICDKHKIIRHPKYSKQYECIKKLVLRGACGEDKLAEAYFHGHILALEMAVDASKGPRFFKYWRRLMKENKIKHANQLL